MQTQVHGVACLPASALAVLHASAYPASSGGRLGMTNSQHWCVIACASRICDEPNCESASVYRMYVVPLLTSAQVEASVNSQPDLVGSAPPPEFLAAQKSCQQRLLPDLLPAVRGLFTKSSLFTLCCRCTTCGPASLLTIQRIKMASTAPATSSAEAPTPVAGGMDFAS